MNLLVCGGGTGGHVFPGVAVARVFKKVAPAPRVVFAGTKHGLERDLVPNSGSSIYFLPGGQLKGKSIVQRLITLIKLPISMLQALRIVVSFAPDVVFGVGGYAAGPVCF